MTSIEREFLKWVCAKRRHHLHVVVGVGDDAAVVEASSDNHWVVTTDTIADGTHFQTERHAWDRIGRKALAVSLSDIAAMGAIPRFVLLNFQLPTRLSLAEVEQIYLGAEKLADEFGTVIVGGDTNRWPGPLVVGSTVIGTVPAGKHWPINGAQLGDRILVTGPLGGSILGRHLDFEPRCRLAQYLQSRYVIHAATDISDSLSVDLSLLVAASGWGAVLHERRIPISAEAAELARGSGRSPLDHALSDGEDFELLLCVAPAVAEQIAADPMLAGHMYDIGEVSVARGIELIAESGQRRRIEPEGYSH